MLDFPNIYSLSTVGVRNHNNADFLLHHLRTDFTGNNGLGKSVIADLLQLILVPLRDEWKPGTDGMGERKIETIPLERQWITHAYAFLNIEKSKGQFITIGVVIPSKSRSPVRPFIIQKSANFERRNLFKTFPKPLNFNDFIRADKGIMDLQELSRHLLEKYDIYLKDFQNKSGVNDYYELLYKNQIIPIDLTKEPNLKSYAKVLQSFSRAKTLDIKKSKSLQNFLFEDNEEIQESFNREKDHLSNYIREYNRARNEILALEDKQKYLNELKIKHDNFKTVNTDFLIKNALFTSERYLHARKAHDDNQKRLNDAFDQYTSAKKELEINKSEYYVKLLEQRKICRAIRTKLEEQQSDATPENIQRLREKRDKDRDFFNRLNRLMPLIEAYKTPEKVSQQFKAQDESKEQLKQLKRLKNIAQYADFQQSKWAEDFKTAYEFYTNRRQQIQKESENLRELLSLYEGNNPDSLFNWALNRKEPLTRAQETVLMNFRDIFIQKTVAEYGAKFTLSPATLLNDFEEEKNGIWLTLGNLRSFIPYVKKQIFDDGKKLTEAIKKGKTEIEEQLHTLKKEGQHITDLYTNLQEIGFNSEFVEIYKNRKNIEKFTHNELLTNSNILFVKDNFTAFDGLDKRQTNLVNLEKRMDTLVSQRRLYERELKENQTILEEVMRDSTRLKSDTDLIENSEPNNFNQQEIEQLKTLRDENKSDLKVFEQEDIRLDRQYDKQKGIFDTASAIKETLRREKETAEAFYLKAKNRLHEETDQVFDNLLKINDLDELTIKELEESATKLGENFRRIFSNIANKYEDTKAEKRNPELYPKGELDYNFYTLLKILCGSIGLEGLTRELEVLNEKRRGFGDLQMKILVQVFDKVEKQYNDFNLVIKRLNLFFESRKVSNNYSFKIEFKPREDINIDWIANMKKKARVHKYGADLFTQLKHLPDEENTPDNLIQNIARQFYSAINCTPSDLLNPKFYFNLSIKMEDDEGKTNSGSGGQSYTALALLCIGRLSIVQNPKDRDRKGIRFIIIEELSNIDDTNFNIFPEIAKQFNYQLLTMTPKPFGSYTDEEWYLHMLVRGKEAKDLNYKAMSFFKNKFKRVDLENHIEETVNIE
mgnify:CR=1 FL=1